MRLGAWIILIASVAFGGFVLFSLFHVEPVQVVHSYLRQTPRGDYVEGELRNTGSKAAAIDLEVHYFDQSGRALGQDKLSLNDLPPGEIEHFSTSAHHLGATGYSIDLNHGRNPYGN